eukprot:1597466-Karenia_brevis.AAC.1
MTMTVAHCQRVGLLDRTRKNDGCLRSLRCQFAAETQRHLHRDPGHGQSRPVQAALLPGHRQHRVDQLRAKFLGFHLRSLMRVQKFFKRSFK